MNRLFIVLLFMSIQSVCGQSKLDTTIFLQSNPGDSLSDIPTNSKKFSVHHESRKLVKSKLLPKIGVYIDHSQWGYRKSSINEHSEYTFINKVYECSGVLLTETTEDISIFDVDFFTLAGAQIWDPEAQLFHREFRTVNNVNVLCIGIVGSIKSLKYQGLGYIYTDGSKVVQLFAYTTQKKYQRNYWVLERFLNGLMLLQ